MTLLTRLLHGNEPGRAADETLDLARLWPAVIRIAYLATGLLLLYYSESFWLEGTPIWNAAGLILVLATSVLAFVILGLGALARPPARAEWLTLAGALVVLFAGAYLRAQRDVPGATGLADAGLFSDYAANLQLLGENPYRQDMSPAFTVYRVSTFFSTSMLTQETRTLFQYPALHALAPIPFKLMGIEDARAVYVVAHAALLVLLFMRTPSGLRPIVLLPLVASRQFLDYTLGGVTDIVWAMLLVAMILSWRRPTPRALLYGLACAYKQLPWLLAPFIVARLLLDDEDADGRTPLRRVLHFGTWASAAFLLFNGPYLLTDPRAWFSGIVEPVRGALVYNGSGLSILTQSGALPLPKSFYSLATPVAMLVLLAVYAINFRVLRSTLWLYPGIVLWFSYRGLQSYYVYWVPLLIASAVAGLKERGTRPVVHQPIRRALPMPVPGWGHWLAHRSLAGGATGHLPDAAVFSEGYMPSMAAAVSGGVSGFERRLEQFIRRTRCHGRGALGVVAAAVGVLLVSSLVSLAGTSRVAVDVTSLRLEGSGDPVDAMEVRIHNASRRPLRPVVSVQRGSGQPFAWTMESGPDSLAPGETGTYRLRTDLPYRMILLAEGAQVVVTDLGGDYRLRGVAKIPPDRSLLNPDAIFNASYHTAADADGIPWGWYLSSTAPGMPALRTGPTVKGFRAVELTLSPTPGREDWESLGLSQWIILPDGDITAWVRPPNLDPTLGEPLGLAYGLEFDDGERRLWVLFGREVGEGEVAENHRFVSVPAPPGEWSRQRVNLRELYAHVGWPLPPPQRVDRGDLELTTRMVTVRLLLAARHRPGPEALFAQFGPLRVDPPPGGVRERMKDDTGVGDWRSVIGYW